MVELENTFSAPGIKDFVKRIIMRLRRETMLLSVAGIVALILLSSHVFPPVDQEKKEELLILTVMNNLERMHFQPRIINDEFSEDVFDLYIDRTFGQGRFITQEGLNRLETYKDDIDNEVSDGRYDFFNMAMEILDKNHKKTQEFYREILAKPFDFSVDEKVELDGDKRPIAKNDQELREFWRKYLKYETLQRYLDAKEEQEQAVADGKEDVKVKMDKELEQEARADVLKMFDKWYSRMEKQKREDRVGYFINTITSVFDPHTNYFKPIDKENFDIRFSGRLEGIGARLQTDDDYTKVSSIVVGGPAWKEKELEENDIIMKVAQEDEEEPVDINGMDINDVVQLIRGKKDTKVRLTVKKVDGTVKEITIVRDIVIMDESFAKSLVLKGADNNRIGYLYLPSFYADFQNPDGRMCATDVGIELEKLKSANVDGIILDLRNNGGGSLRDVVQMSGYFIEKGPIVQVKSRTRKARILKDVDPNVQYKGPLIVMVNSFSASASEILAAALQDYDRAIIVGSPTTFGKGTVQRFIPLDETIAGFDEFKPLGNLKLTMQKFYRINGGSTQLKGVSSDIVLPDNYLYIKTGEREQDKPLKWTEIDGVSYSQDVMHVKPALAEIKARSKARLAEHSIFTKINEHALKVKEQQDETAYSLEYNTYKVAEDELETDAKAYKDLFKEVVIDDVENLPGDLNAIEANESKKERNTEWKKNVSKDVYIKETMAIMHDLIDLTNSNQK